MKASALISATGLAACNAVGTLALDGNGQPRLCLSGLAIAGQLSLDDIRILSVAYATRPG